MKNIQDMERQLKESGKADQVRAIAESRDGQRLMERLDTDRVERAVQSGDSEELRRILMDVLRTGEGRRIAKQLEDTMRQ